MNKHWRPVTYDDYWENMDSVEVSDALEIIAMNGVTQEELDLAMPEDFGDNKSVLVIKKGR